MGKFRLFILFGIALLPSLLKAQTVSVNWNSTFQTVDGFGATIQNQTTSITNTQADMYFSATASNGAGLSLVSSIANKECDNNTSDDLATLTQAVARGALVSLVFYSPPTSMKDSGQCAYGNLLSGSYAAYASYIVSWIQTLQAAGIPIYSVSPMNETDVATNSPTACSGMGSPNNIGAYCITPAQLDTFIKNNLGPAMATAGLSTKIRIADEGQWFLYNWPSSCMTDGSCASFVSIVGSHGYGYFPNGSINGYGLGASNCCSVPASVPTATSTGEVWQSELSSSNTYDPSMSPNGLGIAQNINDYFVNAGMTGWLYWEMAQGACCNDNEGLTDVALNPAKRLYVMGQWSRFVRPGWVRIDATNNPTSGVYVTAFKSGSNGAIVVINSNGSSSSPTFNLTGVTASTIVPFVTDSSRNIVQLSNISGGTSFTPTLAADSVTTFTFSAGGGGGPAANVYISQFGAGSMDASSCANAQTASFFNTSGNWGTGASQIGPSTVVHLCGTFTGTAGGTMLFFQGSGTSGSPITLLFETGANFTSPYWLNGGSGLGGAINSNQQSWITINGGSTCGWNQVSLSVTSCNGSIVDTANGTVLANQAASIGIDVYNSSNITIENIDIHNIYQRVLGMSDSVDQTQTHCIQLDGTDNNITIMHSICHDAGWEIEGGTDGIVEGPGLELYNADHNIQTAGYHTQIFGNHFHDWAIWDTNGDQDHHDGIHCFAGSGGASQQMVIYDNQFDGATGATMNQFIFLEGNTSTTRCMLPGGTAYEFNNVMVGQTDMPAFGGMYGNATTGDVNDVFVNNTMIGSDPNGGILGAFQNIAGLRYTNNIAGGGEWLILQAGTVTYTPTPDYNAWEYCTTFNCFSANGVSSGAFSAWQGAGNDPHGIAQTYPMSTQNYLLLNTACIPGSVAQSCTPQTGSALLGAGTNLTSLCSGVLAPLCSDIAGNARPSSGAWTIGAYQSGTAPSTNPPIPPSAPSVGLSIIQ